MRSVGLNSKARVMADPQRLNLLLREIDRQGGTKNHSAPRPLVSLEQFFEGNDVIGSICANIMDAEMRSVGGLPGIYRLFTRIRQGEGVQDVLVAIYGYEEDVGWPVADSVIVICRQKQDEVASWVDVIRPSETTDITAEWGKYATNAAPDLGEAMRAYLLWWD
jgi:hypothetical protein